MNDTETETSAIDPETEARARAIIEKGFEDAITLFYDKVRDDDVIGPVFSAVVHDWDAHQRTMVDFWSRAVLGTERYKGMPLPPHVRLRLNESHFERWLKLWKEACEASMSEPLADHVGRISANMSRHWSQALAAVERQAQQLEAEAAKQSAGDNA
jgi:hemoglobin